MNTSLDLVVPLLAIGVHVATAVGLLALDGRNVRIRRYLGFVALLTLWLATLALSVVRDGAATTRTSMTLAHLLPLGYLLFALSVHHKDHPPRWLVATITVVGLALLPVSIGAGRWSGTSATVAYQAVLWIAGASLLMRTRFVLPSDGPTTRRSRRRVSVALASVAVLNVALLLYGPARTVPVMIPIMASIAQLVVLVGALRYQLYGIAQRAERVGAERTGALVEGAAELERLALLGEIGATVAHEVRNPLTGIRSLAQRLASGETTDAARQMQFASLIVSEIDRLDRFVGGMLALARRETPAERREAAETLRLAALFDDLLALVAVRAARRGARVVALAGSDATLRAPRGPVAQIVLNLLLNAIDASPDEGTVTLEARADDDGASLVVGDEGPGVPDAMRAHLFQPFAPGAQGSGLGLAVARRVAEANGWRITHDDRAGGGTEFALVMPRARLTSERLRESEGLTTGRQPVAAHPT